MLLEYLFIAFIVICCIQFCYYFLLFGYFSFIHKNNQKSSFNQPISVLICAKNEADNLKISLPLIEKQTYYNFELVLINDGSYDNSLEVMEAFKKNASISVTIVNVLPNEQFWGSKKYALTLGIKAAKYKYLLFTDADCVPTSNNWISEMTSNFSNNYKLILGYGAYKKIKNSFLNKLIRFETLLSSVQYFSYSLTGIPYMGVGRNIAYTKSLFYKANGFAKHIHIKSGDDDLFVNQIATKQNTTICYNNKAFTISNPKTTFKSWINQKRRHISTAKYYKLHHKFLLGLFFSSQILFILMAIVLLTTQFNTLITSSLIVIRYLTVYTSLGFSAKKLDEKDLIIFIPLYELFLIFMQMFIFIKNLISKPSHW